MSNINTYDVTGLGLKINNATVTAVTVVARDPETKKQLDTQRCQLTNSKSRYLFTITKESGEAIQVKASVLTSAGLKQKELDRLYSVGYYADKPGTAKPRLSKEQQATALDAFLS